MYYQDLRQVRERLTIIWYEFVKLSLSISRKIQIQFILSFNNWHVKLQNLLIPMAQRFVQFFLEPQWPSQNGQNSLGFANLDVYSDQGPSSCKLQEHHPLNIGIKLQEPNYHMEEDQNSIIPKQEEVEESSSEEDDSQYSDSSYEKNSSHCKKETMVKIEHEEDSEDNELDEADYKPVTERQSTRIKQVSVNPLQNKMKSKGIKKKKRAEYERGRYKILSQELKKQIVEESRSMTMVEVSRKYHVSVNNICRWRKRCDRRSGAGRKVTDMEMEQRLLDWLLKQHNPIARRQVQSRARKMSRQQGFKASKGWFERFYKRNKLYCNENIEILTHNDYRLRLKSKMCDQSNKKEYGGVLIKQEVGHERAMDRED